MDVDVDVDVYVDDDDGGGGGGRCLGVVGVELRAATFCKADTCL